MSELIWVAVPGGLARPGTALLRVAVVPRLEPGTLADYGLADWPGTLRDAAFQVRVRTAAGIRQAHGVVYRDTARSSVWTVFFPEDTPTYTERTGGRSLIPAVRPLYSQAKDAHRTYRDSAETLTRPGPEADTAIRQRIAQWNTAPPPPPSEAEPPPPPMIDFTGAIAMLREHPQVLLDLGMVFELEVPLTEFAAGTGQVAVASPDPPLRDLVTAPWTRYELGGEGFWPAARDPATRAGVVDLVGTEQVREDGPTPAWAIATFDVDGAVSSLQAEARCLTEDETRPVALPALRSAGLVLLRPGRHADFAARAQQAETNAMAATDQAELTAEDLTLGYRIDIRSLEDPEWRSLCWRHPGYTVTDPADPGTTIPLGQDTEEGHVKPFAAVRTPAAGLVADEAVLRWSGWSLAVPLVNLHGDGPGAAPAAHQMPYEFSWNYEVPQNSLPALRFTHSYQMRIRIADIAGGGRQPAEPIDNARASGLVSYLRHDPVQPPRVGHIAPLLPGATLERLVIRSDGALDAAAFEAAQPQYAGPEERTLFPPTVRFELAEQHMMFDGVSDEQSWEWAQRAFQDDQVTDPAALLPDPVAAGVMAHIPVEPGGVSSELADFSIWPHWPQAGRKSIRLVGKPSAGAAATLSWDGDRLTIGLAQAEEVTLELSSYLNGDRLDHLAMYGWLRSISAERHPGDDGLFDHWMQQVVKPGRHPMVSPIRRIQLVHAVRTPLKSPVWRLPPTAVEQAEHATSALLHPTFDTLDSDSTGRLEAYATYRTMTDAGPRDSDEVFLHSTTISRGDDTPSLVIRQEFGDTRHRQVTYTLKAITRFREYFARDEPDKLFQQIQTQPDIVTIVSTARPPRLHVLAVVPAFRWQRTSTEERLESVRTTRLRVEVAAPWYETGEGESLAVVIAATDPTTPVSRAGRDPIVASAPLPSTPAPGWFPGAAAVQVPGEGITLVPYAVERHDDHWFTDVDIAPAPPSYSPFIQLALARYQRDSLSGKAVSPVTLADPVPLPPDRHLTVVRDGDGVRVTLTGTTPQPANRVDVVLEEATLGTVSDLTELTPDPALPLAAWRALSSATAVGGTPLSITLPKRAAPLRLRVRELDSLDVATTDDTPAELRERPVFLDVIGLPGSWRLP